MEVKFLNWQIFFKDVHFNPKTNMWIHPEDEATYVSVSLHPYHVCKLITCLVSILLFLFLYLFQIVRLNLINHVLALFRDKFTCNTALRNPVFRCESCKGSV